MSAPTQTTGTVPATHSEINTVSQAAPPAYNDEKSSAAPVVNQPRTDDPARVEMAYGSSQANPPLMVTPRESLRQEPAWIDCPFCQKRSITDVRKVNSDTTWLYTFLCCICCGICLVIPLIFGWGADFDHYCKTCNNRVARVPHDGASNATVQVFTPAPAQVASTAPQAPQKA